MRKVIYLLLLLFLLIGCHPKKFTFTDISKFTIDTTALKDQELVSVIYFSGGPDYNNDLKYYYRYIVVSESTGDTINVLCELIHDLNADNPIKRFQSPDSENAFTVDKLLELAQRTQGKGSYEKTKITKVVSNLEFKEKENNDYPYIIGLLVEFNAIE